MDWSFIGWGSVGDYLIGGLMLLSAVPITYYLIRGLNKLSTTAAFRRFERLFQGPTR